MKAQPVAPGEARVDINIRYSGGGRVNLSSAHANERAALLAFKIIISGECDISSVAKLVTEVNDAFDRMPDRSEVAAAIAKATGERP